MVLDVSGADATLFVLIQNSTVSCTHMHTYTCKKQTKKPLVLLGSLFYSNAMHVEISVFGYAIYETSKTYASLHNPSLPIFFPEFSYLMTWLTGDIYHHY